MLSSNNVCKVLHITRQPNSMIYQCYYSLEIFLTSYVLIGFLQNICLFLSTVSDYEQMFSLQILLKKQMKCIKQCVLSILALMLHSVLVSNWAIYVVFDQPWTLLPFSWVSHSCQNSQAATAAWKQLGCDCILANYMQPYLLCVCPQ